MENNNRFSEAEYIQRMANLEEQTRHALDALELAASLGDFQVSISSLHEPTPLLQEAVSKLGSIAEFSFSTIYLVDEASSDFYIGYADREDWKDKVQQAVNSFIDSGMFTFALREGRPVVVHSCELQCRVLLHVLETSSRVRGMYVGVLPVGTKNLTAIEMALLSIVCKNCASGIEVFELYKCFKVGGEDVAQFADSFPTGVIDVDGSGRFLFVNKTASQLLETVKFPEKRSLLDFLVPDEKERIASLLLSCHALGGHLIDLPSEFGVNAVQPMRTKTALVVRSYRKYINLHLVPMLHNGNVILRGIVAPADEMQVGRELAAS